MLIPYSVTQGYSILRKALTDQALVDLDQLMRSVADEPPAVQREALMDLLPALGDQYASATGEVAAVFSGELMELQGVKNPMWLLRRLHCLSRGSGTRLSVMVRLIASWSVAGRC